MIHPEKDFYSVFFDILSRRDQLDVYKLLSWIFIYGLYQNLYVAEWKIFLSVTGPGGYFLTEYKLQYIYPYGPRYQNQESVQKLWCQAGIERYQPGCLSWSGDRLHRSQRCRQEHHCKNFVWSPYGLRGRGQHKGF